MLRLFASLLSVVVCLQQVWTVKTACVNVTDLSGSIIEIYKGPREKNYEKCWNILNPNDSLLEIELTNLDFGGKHCSSVYLKITANNSGETFKWCRDEGTKKQIEVYSDATVYFYVSYYELYPSDKKNFELHYKIETGVRGVKGVRKARSEVVTWLKNNWYSWKWINHIPKAVTALALVEGPYFDAKNVTDKLMLKQRDLQMSISLLRDTNLNEQLATFINSLLSTCHNPRDFHGHNLVDLLKKQVKSENFTHPASYLALCNANERWPEKAYRDLEDVYNTDFFIPFRRDYEAFAVMALSCEVRRNGRDSLPKGRNLLQHLENNIREIKTVQNTNGSFGNMHRTALAIQALIASGHELDSDWNVKNATNYLIKSWPSSDLISTYLILPVLGGKSLIDVGFINCSSSREDEDIVAEVHDYLGPKIKVQYSVLIGEGKDVLPTIFLKVPKHFSAFDVMQFIAAKEKKYKFKYDLDSGKIHIQEMVDIPNDPEEGKFWLFYLKKAGSGNQFKHITLGPDRTALEEGDHIAMWFKKALTRAK